MIVWETYRNIGWVKDNYYDVLTKKDMEYLSKLESGTAGESTDDPLWDERNAFMDPEWGNSLVNNPHFFSAILGEYGYTSGAMPFDGEGNVRVLKVFWKSSRKIKKIKKCQARIYSPLMLA